MNEEREKVDYLVDLCLKQYRLPFTYEGVTVDKCMYYGPDDFYIELLFHNYNGKSYPHRNKIRYMYGEKTQIMFLDKGFPSAAISFDREVIPDDVIPILAKAAFYSTKLKELRESKKITNI